MSQLFCQKCGVQLPTSAVYCPQCGAKVVPVVEESPDTQAAEPVVITAPPELVQPIPQAETVEDKTDDESVDIYAKGFWDNYKYCFTKKYDDLDGRASKNEYWRWTGFRLLLSCGLGAMITFMGPLVLANGEKYTAYFWGCLIFALVHFIPDIAVSVRRLHDIGLSGSYWFLNLIPVLGQGALLFLHLKDGQDEVNQYGRRTNYKPASEKVADALGIKPTPGGGATLLVLLGILIFSMFNNFSLWFEGEKLEITINHPQNHQCRRYRIRLNQLLP